MLETLAKSWLTLQCQMIPNVMTAVTAFDVTADAAFDPSACWPAGSPATPELLEVARLAVTRGSPVVRDQATGEPQPDGPHLGIACPLLHDGRLFGVVAVQTAALPEPQRQVVLQLLQWGAAWLELLLRRESPAPANGLPTVFKIMVAGLQHESCQAAATVVATELAQQLSCERVSLGFLRKAEVRVLALSHSAHFEPRTNLVRNIEAAMDEALMLRETVAYPPLPSGPARALPAHARLVQQEGGEAICTVPLINDEGPIGAITLERVSEQAFDAETVELCEAVATLVGPILEMKRRQDRPPLVKVGDHAVALVKQIIGPRGLRPKLVLGALIGLVGLLSLGTGEYRITAPASLEGRVQRAVVAPYEGYIAAAHARAGEAVKAGAVLAELDDRDLKLERRKWSSERAELLKHHRKALAGLDHAEARILRAQVAQAEAQLGLLDEQLARTRLVAPFDGVVIKGDLSRSLGAPVARGDVLFEVAPLDDYRVVLEVDERDIPDVTAGQNGYLTLSAVPGERLPMAVEHVSAISRSEEGNPAFWVEARLEGTASYLRPGMQGVGKLVVGDRRLVWIWSRRLIGWAQLWIWSWWP